MKRALITGITGQDGSYLAELLLGKGYQVHGLVRRTSVDNTLRLRHLFNTKQSSALFLHQGDVSDSCSLTHLVYEINPDEIYHLAAQSHVGQSFSVPEYTGDVTGIGTTRLLEAVRRSKIKARFYQASTSELFGSQPPPQNESTPFYPQSPYAAAKAYAYWMTANYRDNFGIFAANGILFNHESPRRGEEFVTRKITSSLARIVAGSNEKLRLGNLEARRDWGFAPEYVHCQWLILQQERPDDFVIGTGTSHTVEYFLSEAFSYVKRDWRDHVIIDKAFFRPSEPEDLCANIQKAKKILNWEPKITCADLVKIMMDADLRRVGVTPPAVGEQILKEKLPDYNFYDGSGR